MRHQGGAPPTEAAQKDDLADTQEQTPETLMLKRLLALMLLLPVSALAQDISKVTVRDQDFQLVKTLTSARDLAVFNELWSAKTVQESASGSRFLYKIDVERGGCSVRWLYDLAGFLQVLTVTRTPLYGLAAPQVFNKLLAIDKQ
jgi:hypothetical protein